jgi:hypothetical protein
VWTVCHSLCDLKRARLAKNRRPRDASETCRQRQRQIIDSTTRTDATTVLAASASRVLGRETTDATRLSVGAQNGLCRAHHPTAQASERPGSRAGGWSVFGDHPW